MFPQGHGQASPRRISVVEGVGTIPASRLPARLAARSHVRLPHQCAVAAPATAINGQIARVRDNTAVPRLISGSTATVKLALGQNPIAMMASPGCPKARACGAGNVAAICARHARFPHGTDHPPGAAMISSGLRKACPRGRPETQASPRRITGSGLPEICGARSVVPGSTVPVQWWKRSFGRPIQKSQLARVGRNSKQRCARSKRFRGSEWPPARIIVQVKHVTPHILLRPSA